jgi:hypothetical protein
MGITRPAAADNAATEAYKLRMKGEVDQARTLLEETLSERPDDAAAHYELARTRMHMALGDPKNLEQDFGNCPFDS